MKRLRLYLAAIVFFLLPLASCSDNHAMEKDVEADSYTKVRESAWRFLKDKGWNNTTKENWQSAKVEKVVIDNGYELLDKAYKGKEALSVSFEDNENVVVGIPKILVDANTNKVIGYMPSE
ncbi:hypothetical protein RRU94_17235 [Domibacillus sp. DTU_2020_1001157_1_SI_ALB_TIR_016]|uniref:hypothetical protein n=1 Tax=Domibacillus sp. DTU_2020_1001157_1_SI_ALB_TIR_016 TaxID=3077789 RepID=UPI0028E29860|nr:hypothetical protein [Domibacillus sp. DTU_2020_1001157_1_SI_ALB_TIR_016]WNS79292.1 hypothetical protein RRU94_17235 [Domibacillus sp. DTU_2020_1001157_1_SI_ALB_TIR_016]